MVGLPAITFFVIRDSDRTAAATRVIAPATTSTQAAAVSNTDPAAWLSTPRNPAAARKLMTADRSLPVRVFVSNVSSPTTVEHAPESPRGAISTPVTAQLSLGQRALFLWRQIPATISAWLPWAVCVWIFGVLSLSLWNVAGWFAVQRLKSRATSPVSAAIQEAAARISQKLGLARCVRLLQSALVESPIVIGALKPVILLPASLITELPPDQLESLLAHELAHVLRQDYLVNLLQTVIETLLFYHPAVWWVSSKVRAERENCCDDLAVGIAADRAIYVRALAAVAGARASAIAPAATGGILLPRLRRILGVVDPQAGHPSRWLTGAVMLSLCGGAIAVMAVNLRSATAQTSTTQTVVPKAAAAKTASKATLTEAKKPKEHGEPQFPTKGKVRIRVTDAAGKPVPAAGIHASVWTKEKFRRNQKYTCDSDGVVDVDLPKTLSILRLWVAKKGYCEQFVNFQTNTAVHTLVLPDEYQFRLIKGIVIGGVVKDEAGRPIQGVKVDDTLTDAKGRWTIDGVQPDKDVSIKVTHPDYLSDRYGGELQRAQKVTSESLRAQQATIVMRRGSADYGESDRSGGRAGQTRDSSVRRRCLLRASGRSRCDRRAGTVSISGDGGRTDPIDGRCQGMDAPDPADPARGRHALDGLSIKTGQEAAHSLCRPRRNANSRRASTNRTVEFG